MAQLDDQIMSPATNHNPFYSSTERRNPFDTMNQNQIEAEIEGLDTPRANSIIEALQS